METTTQIQQFTGCKPAQYCYKKSPSTGISQGLQLMHQNDDSCDIKLEMDNNQSISAHKVVLASASPYFKAMFANFAEKNQDVVVIKELNSTALQLLVKFIYSGKIVITIKNVQVLLQTANFLLIEEVTEVCCYFLQSQLCPKNCISINAIADLYSCTKLFTNSKLYIKKHYGEVVGFDDFLSLLSGQVVNLISSDEISVSSEEKVFESVIRWVKHELCSRKCILPQLMEHVRLALLSNDYIINKVAKEPLIKNCLKCNDYISEALNFHLLKSEEPIPKNIRMKRRYGDKVILVISCFKDETWKISEWYDPKINQWHFRPKLNTHRYRAGLAVVNDNLVFTMGGYNRKSLKSVAVLDLSLKSLCWKSSVDMLIERDFLGVGVINNYLYAVGGMNRSNGYLNSAEVFDNNTQEWRMISSMSTKRVDFGVGVLDYLLYVVGGYNFPPVNCLDTVECYTPSLDTWTSVAKMRVRRRGVRVEALDGVLYAVGGYDGSNTLSSVEAYRPSIGVWTFIADMHSPRCYAGVVVLNGLLYVIGGYNGTSSLDSVECYCPHTNKWSIVTALLNYPRALSQAVAFSRTHHFNA